eukprot:TRINITY_DN4997_c0_g1_i2.p1 TRINITY_DN4997_c0_g1~~TRINITY_DN4997_c0_g1_i2.p1  ORF type:complete len:232 (+),score=81.81 TRINITY_DN4997_c0_g1_i2:392-1087(+)
MRGQKQFQEMKKNQLIESSTLFDCAAVYLAYAGLEGEREGEREKERGKREPPNPFSFVSPSLSSRIHSFGETEEGKEALQKIKNLRNTFGVSGGGIGLFSFAANDLGEFEDLFAPFSLFKSIESRRRCRKKLFEVLKPQMVVQGVIQSKRSFGLVVQIKFIRPNPNSLLKDKIILDLVDLLDIKGLCHINEIESDGGSGEEENGETERRKRRKRSSRLTHSSEGDLSLIHI